MTVHKWRVIAFKRVTRLWYVWTLHQGRRWAPLCHHDR